MKSNSALGEKSEVDVCDAISEDELPGEQNQLCPLLELCLHYSVGCARECAGIRQRHERVRNVYVRHVHRTRGSRVSGQVFVVIRTDVILSECQFCCVDARCRVYSWLHTRWWFSLVSDPIIYAPWSMLLGTGKRRDMCSLDTQAGHPSRLPLAVRKCGAIWCFADPI